MFPKNYGTCNVALSDGYESLYYWVRTTRRNKKKNRLTEKQIAILNEIGFCWDVKEAVWLETFNILNKHVKEYGTLKMSSKTPYYNKVTIWLAKQRKYSEEGRLEEKRKDMLKSIGAL